MPFKKAQDLLIKATNQVFGDDVVYTYEVDGSTSNIRGVFDHSFVEVQGVSNKKPTLRIRLADLNAEPVEGDTLSISAVEYMVRDHEPDSFGSTTLILEKI